MSRSLVSHLGGSTETLPAPLASQRQYKISTACGACQCSGGQPRCEACTTRDTACVYDVASDRRRKIANQRNVRELTQAQQDLKMYRQLLGGIIATVRAGDLQTNTDLVLLIRSGVDLSQLAAHVGNKCRSNPDIQRMFDRIEFLIDDLKEFDDLKDVGDLEEHDAPETLF